MFRTHFGLWVGAAALVICAPGAAAFAEELGRTAPRGWSRYADHATSELGGGRRAGWRNEGHPGMAKAVGDAFSDARADSIVERGIARNFSSRIPLSNVVPGPWHGRHWAGGWSWAGFGGWLADPELPHWLVLKGLMK